MKFIRTCAIVIVVALLSLLVIFVAQNSHTAVVNFLIYQSTMPLSVLLFITFVLGAAVAFVVSFFYSMAQKRKASKEREQKEQMSNIAEENRRLKEKLGQPDMPSVDIADEQK